MSYKCSSCDSEMQEQKPGVIICPRCVPPEKNSHNIGVMVRPSTYAALRQKIGPDASASAYIRSLIEREVAS